nr:hypothetical protein GEV33_014959 [Tenebrio molitor]
MIPEYDGDQSTLFDFIEAVNFAIENVPENQQNALIFVIKSKLVGKARKFISSRQLREWNDIKDLLISHYGDCRDTEGLLYDLTSTFQKSNETPRAFAQRIENLLTKIRSSVALNNELNQEARNALNSSHEKIALKAFLAGLSDPLEKCKDLQEETLLCSDLIPFPYENPPCEIEVLTKLTANEKCHPVLLDIEDYNVQKVKTSKWIIITIKNLPITCSSGGPKAEFINQNSILTMAPRCTAFIGSIQVHAQEEKFSNYSEADVIPSIYYDWRENFTPPLNQRHQLKPLKINTLNLDDLKTAEFKLNQYKDQLDNLGKESFAHRHLSTFAIITIIVVVAIIGSHSDDGPPRPGSCCPQIFNYCNIRSNISRRPSIRIETDDHSEEVAYQRDILLTSLSTKRRL